MASYPLSKPVSVNVGPSSGLANRPKIVSNVAIYHDLGAHHKPNNLSIYTMRKLGAAEEAKKRLVVRRSSKSEDQQQQRQQQKMGVEKQVLKAGTGPKPSRGQEVTVHCTGFGKNGDLNVKFWSTKDPGQQPFSFKIGQGSVIKGWDEGVADMQIGEIARLQCSPDYAYGPGGFPTWGILPNSVLVFEIEVLGAK